MPNSLAELQSLLAGDLGNRDCRWKVLGAGHSFSDIADTAGEQISLTAFDQIEIDAKARIVRVGAGVNYATLATELHRQGFALHNMASLPHINVAGACATGTHGSGSANGNLATAVVEVELVDAAGQLHRIADPEDTAVHLGALGAVTSLVLRIEPAYSLAQSVFQNLSFDALQDGITELFSIGYSVSMFTDWQGHRAAQVWVKSRDDRPLPKLGATPAAEQLHPLPGHSAEHCTEQMGVPGPWFDRLPHFRMNFQPSSGLELQSEYFVDMKDGYAALKAIETLRNELTPLLFVSEIRTISADRLWMSPCYGRDSVAFHFTWRLAEQAVLQVLPKLEAALAPFQARPHWGKLFTMDGAQVRSLYPELGSFRNLAQTLDPAGRFHNDYLLRNVL